MIRRARKGERAAFTILFLNHLPALEQFVKRQVHYYESLGVIEPGLLDHCAILDQVYLAGLGNVKQMPPRAEFEDWLKPLADHITRQQARVEQQEAPGLVLERPSHEDGNVDTDLWEYYQPDDVMNVEDTITDPSSADPERLIELRETTGEIEKALAGLPEALRDCLLLRARDGLSVDEIAALKHKPPAVIRQALHDAREALRRAQEDPLQ